MHELNIGDTVTVLPFDSKGIIIGVYIDAVGPMYKTRYYLESEVREEFFYERELGQIPGNTREA